MNFSFPNTANNSIGFQFKKRKQPINWKLLSSIHVDRIIKQSDTNSLQVILPNLTFCDVESEEFHNVDHNFIKMFQLAQLAIEYLLYTQETTLENQQKNQKDATELESRNKKVQDQIAELQNQVSILTKENKQLKKTVSAYQLWSKVPGGLGNQQPIASTYHRCRYCSKVFNSEYYLESHLVRRHADKPNYIAESQNIPHSFNFMPPPVATPGLDPTALEKINETIEKFGNKILETEMRIKADIEKKLDYELSKKDQKTDEGYRQERLEHEKELQDLKTMIMQQMEEERKLLREERNAFEEIRRQQESKRSNLGALESDDENGESVSSKNHKKLLEQVESKYDTMFERMQSLFEKGLSGVYSKLGELDANKANPLDRSFLEEAIVKTEKKVNDLEEALMLQSKRKKDSIKPEEAPSSEKFDQAVWQRYLSIMKDFKNSSCPSYPNLKSRYLHGDIVLQGKTKETQFLLESEAEKFGVTIQNIKDHAQDVQNAILQQREADDKKRVYNSAMREYILEELENVVKSDFKIQPLKPIVIPANNNANIITLPNKAEFFAKYKSATVGSSTSAAWSDTSAFEGEEDDDKEEDDFEEISRRSMSSLQKAKHKSVSSSLDKGRSNDDIKTKKKNVLKNAVGKASSFIDNSLTIGEEFEISDLSADDESEQMPVPAPRRSKSSSLDRLENQPPEPQSNKDEVNKRSSLDSLDKFEISDIEEDF